MKKALAILLTVTVLSFLLVPYAFADQQPNAHIHVTLNSSYFTSNATVKLYDGFRLLQTKSAINYKVVFVALQGKYYKVSSTDKYGKTRYKTFYHGRNSTDVTLP